MGSNSREDLPLPGPSSSNSILLLPIPLSTKTRSKKRPPNKSPATPLGQDCEVNCDEATSEARLALCQQPKTSSESIEVFERPLTRARKRHMARICEMQPPVPKHRRKNL